ncbi:MAG: 4Fe-4S binding protein [Chloroflexota bacterium]|nr:4Fe-4S binding protein [Chloroflexota bacterium]
MFGTGLLKGLSVTIKRAVETYVDDVKAIPSRYAYGRDMIRQGSDEEGIYTIQYPEEKRQLPERFRYLPMLIHETSADEDRCTACGICSKVCPPQCIWIIRSSDEKGKPVPKPAEFFIDTSICMSCGFCAEFCPFDAIKMNHDYELAVFERYPDMVYNLEELTVPVEYYAAIYPTQYAAEEERRAEEEAKKAAKAAKRKKPAAPAARAASGAAAASKVAAKPAPHTSGLSPEELEKRREEAKARAAARKAAAAGEAEEAKAESEPLAAQSQTSGLSPEELEKRREEARARVAARKAAAAGEVLDVDKKAVAPEPVTVAVTYGKVLGPKARTSGTLSYEELEKRRAASYARYKARKGDDAKVLPH